MFTSNTLFILGAGASVPYGFPVGKKLITEIIKDMEDDIFIPCYTKIISTDGPFWNSNDEKNDFLYNFELMTRTLNNMYSIKESVVQDNFHTYNENIMEFMLQNGINRYTEHFVLRQIKSVDIFRKLLKALIEFDPVSIDAFLRDNPSHQTAGKIMIIYSLLKREDPNLMTTLEHKNKDNWYSLLYNDLVSGCADKPKKLLQNKVKFTTFNYDLSLDHYLQSRIASTEVFKEKQHNDLTIAEEFLSRHSINHIYGTCYKDNTYKYGYYNTTPTEPKRISGKLYPRQLTSSGLQNFKRFIFSVCNYSNIKTMYQERKQNISDNIKNLEWAKDIIIIGFGFDRDNLDLLGFPDNMKGLYELLKNKTIRYLNFKGTVNSLSQEFSKLELYSKKEAEFLSNSPSAESTINIIESKADNISNAYVNDFKKYLVR